MYENYFIFLSELEKDIYGNGTQRVRKTDNRSSGNAIK